MMSALLSCICCFTYVSVMSEIVLHNFTPQIFMHCDSISWIGDKIDSILSRIYVLQVLRVWPTDVCFTTTIFKNYASKIKHIKIYATQCFSFKNIIQKFVYQKLYFRNLSSNKLYSKKLPWKILKISYIKKSFNKKNFQQRFSQKLFW